MEDIEKLRKKVIKDRKFLDYKNDPKPLALYKEIIDVCDKLEDIKDCIVEIKDKPEEVREYYDEIGNVVEAINGLKDSFDGKDMSVNVPLDDLASAIAEVEKAVKSIPKTEVKIPESIYINNLDDVVRTIENIPEFPLKDIGKMFSSLIDKISKTKVEVEKFDYSKFDDLIRAVKNIKIGATTISSTAPSVVGLKDASENKINPSTSDNQVTLNDLTTTLTSLTETLQELIQRLAPLAGAMSSTAQLRVTQTAVPSTAVTGPITSALSIAEKAVGGVSYGEKVAITNATTILSNINNTLVT